MKSVEVSELEGRAYPANMMQVDRREKYQQMRTLLNEKQWRQYLALEAKERGSVSLVAQEAAVSANTVRREVREVEAGAGYTPGDRQREKGGGHKKASEKDATVLADVEGLLEPKGDRTRLLKWTSKSVAHLKAALQAMGHTIADTALRNVLLALGYRLAANKKTIEGNSHEDRDGQFAHMKERCAQFERAGHPIMSVDCKKKELLITADGGGSNGVRNRLWKQKLQNFANEEHLSITVAHYPPATVPLEQDRTPALLLHFHQVASQTADVPGSRPRAHFAYDNHSGLNRDGGQR